MSSTYVTRSSVGLRCFCTNVIKYLYFDAQTTRPNGLTAYCTIASPKPNIYFSAISFKWCKCSSRCSPSYKSFQIASDICFSHGKTNKHNANVYQTDIERLITCIAQLAGNKFENCIVRLVRRHLFRFSDSEMRAFYGCGVNDIVNYTMFSNTGDRIGIQLYSHSHLFSSTGTAVAAAAAHCCSGIF